MVHLDLFSGIGGFALAVDTVWPESEHIFCDNDKFCQQVLKKHWPNSKIYGDIRTITNTESWQPRKQTKQKRWEDFGGSDCDLITGGFPCQPFSQAGKRRGTEDDRHLWPEMLRVIQDFKPTWVIAENVRGLLTIEGGLVFEQVCLDLEREGYQVQAFIIPAVAVNAPHRRDRVWIVAHSKSAGAGSECGKIADKRGRTSEDRGTSIRQIHGTISTGGTSTADSNAPNTNDTRSGTSANGVDGNRKKENQGRQEQPFGRIDGQSGDAPDTKCRRPYPTQDKQKLESEGSCKFCVEQPGNTADWQRPWLEVATRLCRVDDGLSPGLDFAGWTKARHRVERLKSLGNSIVPQVAIEILKAIKYAE